LVVGGRPHCLFCDVEVSVPGLMDLTGPGALAAVGLSAADVAADSDVAGQQVGRAAAWLERTGLFVPSARDAGSNPLILWNLGPDDDLVSSSREVVDERQVDDPRVTGVQRCPQALPCGAGNPGCLRWSTSVPARLALASTCNRVQEEPTRCGGRRKA